MKSESQSSAEAAEVETVADRLEKHGRMIALTQSIGAGLIALVAVFAALNFGPGAQKQCPAVIGAIFVSCLLLASVCILIVRGGAEYQRELLKRLIRKRLVSSDSSIAQAFDKSRRVSSDRYMSAYHAFYFAGLGFTILAALMLVLRAWIQAALVTA